MLVWNEQAGGIIKQTLRGAVKGTTIALQRAVFPDLAKSDVIKNVETMSFQQTLDNFGIT